MKAFILTFMFCLFPLLTCSAQEHWVYIRTYDKPTVDPKQIAQGTYGRSKKGDIVDIRPVNSTTYPSEVAQKVWAIIKVKGLTEQDILKYTQVWQEQVGIQEVESIRTIDKDVYVQMQISQDWTPFKSEPQDITEDMLKKFPDNDYINKVWLKGLIDEPIYKKIADRENKLDIDILGFDKVGIYPTAVDFDLIKLHIRQKTPQDLIAYHKQYRWYALRRPFIYAYHRIIKSAVAETVTTINWPGETYDTLTIWEDAVDGDLVATTTQPTGHLYDDDGDLSDGIAINDSTTNATYYMKISSPSTERHDGTEYSGAKVYNSSVGTDTINNADSFTVIEWLIIEETASGGAGDGVYSNEDITIRNCIISKADDNGIYIYACGAELYNNIIYNADARGIMMYDEWNTFNVYNNTIYNCPTNGIYRAHNRGASNATNNLVITGGGDDYAGASNWDTFTTNGAGDTTGDPAGLDSLTTGEWESVTGGSEDLHLATGATSIDAGTDLGGGLWDTDIDNRDRDTEDDTWDVGADEYVSAVTRRVIFISKND